METVAVTEEKVKKKRGRKPSKNRKGYFYEEQEQAVVDYISTDDEIVKNKIYNKVLKPAFTKMAESIIRRYKLYLPDEEYQETFDDTLSFLMTKLSKFDPTKNYKAYSYCGTICKNYLIFKTNSFAKKQKRSVSYDNPLDNLQSTINNSLDYSYNEGDAKSVFMHELTGNTIEGIEKIINNKKELELTKEEIKVGQALIDLIKNWDDLFVQMGSNKFNKSSILMYLRETTMLNNKALREALKTYKTMYYNVKLNLINE